MNILSLCLLLNVCPVRHPPIPSLLPSVPPFPPPAFPPPSRWKEKEIDGEQRRRDGLCPFTPRETALFLRALGFPNTTLIYIAAGDIYGSRGLQVRAPFNEC